MFEFVYTYTLSWTEVIEMFVAITVELIRNYCAVDEEITIFLVDVGYIFFLVLV